MDHSPTSSVNISTQPKPTQFLSASHATMDHFANNSSADTVQTSSHRKPVQFLSASEVMAGHSSASTDLTPPKNGDTTESGVAKSPGDQVHPHGGIISSTGSIIYPPPPPPFMRFEESAPSSTQADFTTGNHLNFWE